MRERVSERLKITICLFPLLHFITSFGRIIVFIPIYNAPIAQQAKPRESMQWRGLFSLGKLKNSSSLLTLTIQIDLIKQARMIKSVSLLLQDAKNAKVDFIVVGHPNQAPNPGESQNSFSKRLYENTSYS